MTGVSTTVGLISGINFVEIVDALIDVERLDIVKLEDRVATHEATQTGLTSLEANLLTLGISANQFGLDSTFNSKTVATSNPNLISVSTNNDAVPGTFQFQSVRRATTHEVISTGFANTDSQTIGAGSLVIAQGGQLHQSTELTALNAGAGIRRGSIRITDRSGTSVEFDLSNAFTLDDILDVINTNSDLGVTAAADGSNLVLTDTTGSTSTNLTVVDLNGGHTAEDLGLLQSVASDTLTGADIFELSGDFTLDFINDGNGPLFFDGAADIKITTTDDSELEIDLDSAATLNDVISAINNHVDNLGKVTASLNNNRLELTDISGGGGSSAFAVEDINNASVVAALGLTDAATGTQITGQNLLAGMNSVLLRNLNGGQGIDALGQITVTDRTGLTATLDLANAESLDEVIAAINNAEDALSSDRLNLTARINNAGTGILIQDTSGSTANNLTITDVATGTLAKQLGIEIDDAVTSVDSGPLGLRFVNEATALSNYAPDGGSVGSGSFRITDSQGAETTVSITSSVETVGDVLQRINSAISSSSVQVAVELNDTGDGFVLIDEAGGSENLAVTSVTGTTADDLRIAGTGATGSDGKSRISSRLATVIDVDADDTLDDLVTKINQAGRAVTATVIDDGSAFNSKRLSLIANESGSAASLVIDDGDLGFNFSTRTEGRDALLRVGGSVETGFLVSSNTDHFSNPFPGIDVSLLSTSSEVVDVTVAQDTSNIQSVISGFVTTYNSYIDNVRELTKFNQETAERGVLQGENIILRAESRLSSLINRSLFGPAASVRSLNDLGVRITTNGKLELDTDQLTNALAEDPDAVTDFFLTKETGFADLLDETLDSLTDPFTGTFTLERNALQATVDDLNVRIEQLDDILAVRRQRLLLQFINMENALSTLQSQGNLISNIQPLAFIAGSANNNDN